MKRIFLSLIMILCVLFTVVCFASAAYAAPENEEIIDSHDFTGKLLGNERCKVIPDGKHSGATLPLKDFFTETINM